MGAARLAFDLSHLTHSWVQTGKSSMRSYQQPAPSWGMCMQAVAKRKAKPKRIAHSLVHLLQHPLQHLQGRKACKQ